MIILHSVNDLRQNTLSVKCSKNGQRPTGIFLRIVAYTSTRVVAKYVKTVRSIQKLIKATQFSSRAKSCLSKLSGSSEMPRKVFRELPRKVFAIVCPARSSENCPARSSQLYAPQGLHKLSGALRVFMTHINAQQSLHKNMWSVQTSALQGLHHILPRKVFIRQSS